MSYAYEATIVAGFIDPRAEKVASDPGNFIFYGRLHQ